MRVLHTLHILLPVLLAAAPAGCCNVPNGWSMTVAGPASGQTVVQLMHLKGPIQPLDLVVASGVERVRVQSFDDDQRTWNVGVIKTAGGMETEFVKVSVEDGGDRGRPHVSLGGASGTALLVDARGELSVHPTLEAATKAAAAKPAPGAAPRK